MPLSDHEQHILRQIEQELQQDPTFSERVSRTSRHRLTMLIVGLIVGIALIVAGLTVNFWLAFVAFLGVLVIAVMLEAEIRVVGRQKLGSLPINAWIAGAARQSRRPE